MFPRLASCNRFAEKPMGATLDCFFTRAAHRRFTRAKYLQRTNTNVKLSNTFRASGYGDRGDVDWIGLAWDRTGGELL
jgi:hypothetical protein